MQGIKITPRVSICVVTYNQEKYIRQCLQSILDQKTDFDFEIIVGDDCSTDGTKQIVLDFADRYPDIVIPIFHIKNIGPTKNFVATHLRAQGEFVAHLDGDDLAYSGKLQIQYEYLTEKNTHSLVWHRVEIFDDEGNTNCLLHKRLNEIVDINEITFENLAKFGSLGAASSLMYRRSAAKFLTSIEGEVLDYYIAICLLKNGNAARLDNILGGYRVNPFKKTASRRSFNYLGSSPMRLIYADHLRVLYLNNKSLKNEIFLNALFSFLVELRFLSRSALPFFILTLRTINFISIKKIPKYFINAFKLRER